MKKVAIVFIILGVVGVVLSNIYTAQLTNELLAAMDMPAQDESVNIFSIVLAGALASLFAILGIVNLIKDKKSIGIGVCLIIFTGVVGGILYLVYFGTKDQNKTEPAIEENNEGANFCPHCGAKLPKDSEFCPECGKKIEE